MFARKQAASKVFFGFAVATRRLMTYPTIPLRTNSTSPLPPAPWFPECEEIDPETSDDPFFDLLFAEPSLEEANASYFLRRKLMWKEAERKRAETERRQRERFRTREREMESEIIRRRKMYWGELLDEDDDPAVRTA